MTAAESTAAPPLDQAGIEMEDVEFIDPNAKPVKRTFDPRVLALINRKPPPGSTGKASAAAKYTPKVNTTTTSNVHHVSVYERCGLCAMTFSSAAECEMHKARCHSAAAFTSTSGFQCLVCSQVFDAKEALRSHLRYTHKSLETFVCSFCGKKFSFKSALVAHLRTHSGERPFRCSVCGKSFSVRSACRAHMLLHSEQQLRPFQCPQCDRCFRDAGTLSRHQLIHVHDVRVKVERLSCSQCGKTFRHDSALENHMRKHEEGNAAYHACPVCQLKYKTKDELIAHVQSAHSELIASPEPIAAVTAGGEDVAGDECVITYTAEISSAELMSYVQQLRNGAASLPDSNQARDAPTFRADDIIQHVTFAATAATDGGVQGSEVVVGKTLMTPIVRTDR